MPEFLERWLRTNAVLLVSIAVGFVTLVLLGLWLAFGKGPRLRRSLKHIEGLIAQGDVPQASAKINDLRKQSLSSGWSKRVDLLEASLLDWQVANALQKKSYEEALAIALRSAHMQHKPDLEARGLVQNAMLEEAQRLFSQNSESDVPAIVDLLNRALRVQSPCREASFWTGMCFLRVGQIDEALQYLNVARTGSPDWQDETGANPSSPIIDPPLYMGAILLRGNRPKEALRFLTEANRLDPNCPIVKLQLGAALIAADRDPAMAVRVLQLAVGPKGIGLWTGQPSRMWVEAFPENRSYVRKLAEKFPYVCPIWGAELGALLYQGTLALAQGYYRQGNYQEAAEQFSRATHEGAPSLAVLRGLGTSLARLGKFDEAFTQLRIAHELEPAQDRVSAGYLALCVVRRPGEDSVRGLAWAIGLLTPFSAPNDPEWIGIMNAVFAAARTRGVSIPLDDQLYLCEHLLIAGDLSAHSAEAFHHLQLTHPEAMRSEYAWHFCRIQCDHPIEGAGVLRLFEIALGDPASTRAYFEQKQWNFDDALRAFLERTSVLAPGAFPAVLGSDYPAEGERLLLEHAQALEDHGDFPAAAVDLRILSRLAPNNLRVLDRLARLHHRLGESAQAIEVLGRWHQLHDADPLPLVRRALLCQLQDAPADAQQNLRQALTRATGKKRAAIAFLGARLALQAIGKNHQGDLPQAILTSAQQFLLEVLRDQPDHPQALWYLAAICALNGDRGKLAQMAPHFKKLDVRDPYVSYFAGVCHFEAKDFVAVTQACQRVRNLIGPAGNGRARFPLELESDYLAGQAWFAQGNLDAAREALTRPAQASECPSMAQAQMLLGILRFQQEHHEDAAEWWQRIDAGKRAAWQLNEPLAATMFLSALDLFRRGEFEAAGERLRQAGRIGCRDRRLGSLLLLSLYRAGQQAIYG